MHAGVPQRTCGQAGGHLLHFPCIPEGSVSFLSFESTWTTCHANEVLLNWSEWRWRCKDVVRSSSGEGIQQGMHGTEDSWLKLRVSSSQNV